MTRTFYIIRHAESLGNAGAPNAGSNPGLSPMGERQADALAAHLAGGAGVQAIWSSPFERAVQTACAVGDALDLPVRLEPRLHEFFYNDWFDLETLRLPSLAEIVAAHAQATSGRDDDHWWPRQAEDFPDLYARLEGLADDLLQVAHEGVTVLVGHGASVAALAAALVPTAEPRIELVANASITEVRCEAEGRRLARFSDVAHMINLP